MFLLSIIFAVMLFNACTCKTCGIKNEQQPVPDYVFYKTDKYIQMKVGRDFFEKYIHADYKNSIKKRDKYEVRYNFRMIDYDFVDEEILIVTDSSGNILNGALSKGIPSCMNETGGCDFKINKNRAIEIGVANSLPEGIKEWAVEFRWSELVNKYVWHIITTTAEFGGVENYKAEGEELMIDPVNGDILKKRMWSIR